MSESPTPPLGPTTVQLNLNELADVVQVGGRRASTFLGLALNAMSRDDVFEYRLGELAITDDSFRWPIEMSVPEVTPTTIADAKQAFTAWVIGSALRDLLEHFCLMLDRSYEMVSWVAHAKQIISTDEISTLRNIYRRTTSVGHKVHLFRENFAISSPLCDYLDSLYKTRNALSHGFGVVRAHDTSDGRTLQVRWRGMESWSQGQHTGKRTSIKNILNVVLPEPQTIQMHPVDRLKEFPVGSKVTLEAIDLSEICHFVAVQCTLEFLKEVADALTKYGVNINAPSDAAAEPNLDGREPG